MVALFVIFTIIAFLAVDGIVLALRRKREMVTSTQGKGELVFAQDGGKPVKKGKNKEKEE